MLSLFYQSVEARAKIVRGNKDMVSSLGTVPEGKVSGNKLNGGGHERPGVTDCREPINGAEIAGHVHRDKEKISFVRVKCPYIIAVRYCSVNSYLRRKQMVAASLISQPVCVVFRWQFVDIYLQIF